ncbi:unnamed protein product [Callosobruchus maculatus]|uniref:Uncharacterized protein n=1 Tax=Callosobruchus maculatus TaxID=64391 RepID=A0A653CBU4_CALMS|nr:unnamed protein product [Callosobruchus maculatus]
MEDLGNGLGVQVTHQNRHLKNLAQVQVEDSQEVVLLVLGITEGLGSSLGVPVAHHRRRRHLKTLAQVQVEASSQEGLQEISDLALHDESEI